MPIENKQIKKKKQKKNYYFKFNFHDFIEYAKDFYKTLN